MFFQGELSGYIDDLLSPTAISPAAILPAAITPTTISPAAISPTTISPAAISPTTISPAAISPAAISPAVISPAVNEDNISNLDFDNTIDSKFIESILTIDNSRDNAEESSSIKRRSTRKRKSCNYYEKNQDVIRENAIYVNRNKKLKQANRFFEKTIRDKLNEMKDLDKILKQNSLKIREQINIITL